MAGHPYDLTKWSRYKNTVSYNGDPRYHLEYGIDVSYYQGNIDWNKVKASGIDFAIIRIGYRTSVKGRIYVDRKFRSNIQNAKTAGIKVGVYFFAQAKNEAEATEEANYMISKLSGYDLDLPVAYDPKLVRKRNARANHLSQDQYTKNAIAFCSTIENQC